MSTEPKEQAELTTGPDAKPHDEEQEDATSPLGSPVHVRQKSVEEIECEKVAAVVAIQIVDDDKQLSDVILPPPEHKMTTDFMSGLFAVDNVPAVPSFAASLLSPRTKEESSKETRRR